MPDTSATYAELDRLIVEAIRSDWHPIYEGKCNAEAYRIGELTGRSDFRIIDGRMTALRKRGVISFNRELLKWEALNA